ncbi:Hap43p-repressed protein [Candida albicans P78042]|nr:Hap43p-repressed protein [Candida albicans P78042]
MYCYDDMMMETSPSTTATLQFHNNIDYLQYIPSSTTTASSNNDLHYLQDNLMLTTFHKFLKSNPQYKYHDELLFHRLLNICWRRIYKNHNNLKEYNPLEINWDKNSDITWLYGPQLELIEKEKETIPRSCDFEMEVDNISNSSTSVNSTDEDNDDGRLDLFHDDLDNSSISSIESYCSTLEEEEEKEKEDHDNDCYYEGDEEDDYSNSNYITNSNCINKRQRKDNITYHTTVIKVNRRHGSSSNIGGGGGGGSRRRSTTSTNSSLLDDDDIDVVNAKAKQDEIMYSNYSGNQNHHHGHECLSKKSILKTKTQTQTNNYTTTTTTTNNNSIDCYYQWVFHNNNSNNSKNEGGVRTNTNKQLKKKKVSFNHIVNTREIINGMSVDYDFLDHNCL